MYVPTYSSEPTTPHSPPSLTPPHLSDADGVVGQDVVDGQLREGGHTHGGAHVVGEHQEGGAGAAVEAEVGDTVEDGPHGVLADAVVEVAAGVAAVSQYFDTTRDRARFRCRSQVSKTQQSKLQRDGGRQQPEVNDHTTGTSRQVRANSTQHARLRELHRRISICRRAPPAERKKKPCALLPDGLDNAGRHLDMLIDTTRQLPQQYGCVPRRPPDQRSRYRSKMAIMCFHHDSTQQLPCAQESGDKPRCMFQLHIYMYI